MGDNIETIIMIIVFIVAPIVKRLFTKKEEDATWADEASTEPEPYPESPAPYPAPYPDPDFDPYPSAPAPYAAPAPQIPEWETERQEVLAKLAGIATHADSVAASARVERITIRFVDTLENFVARPARRWMEQLNRSNAAPPQEVYWDLRVMEMVFGQVESFIGQRRNQALAPRLGDADAFALSCYEPVAQFAAAEGLDLASNTPVCEFGPYDLSIATGFIPSGLAPIYLPPDFFQRIAWWPALAHEIGHDFYRATEGLDEELRAEIGLVSASAGRRPLAFGQQGLSMHELVRVFGGWFEELFCDVFGTLMCGPAYVWTMIEHFATPYDASQIVRVRIDHTGRYGEHPPRHLRFLAAVHVLELDGRANEANELREEWERLHGEPDGIYFPIAGQLIGIPVQPLAAVATDIAGRLYGDRMSVFNGYSLSSIPGVDYGPHAHAEAERVRNELLRGQVPHHTGARSVISGAVLAWHDAPERERELIRLARAAIAAEGSFEDDVDAYDVALQRGAANAEIGGLAEAREAFLLHTILSPSPSMRRMGLGVRRGGFLSRSVLPLPRFSPAGAPGAWAAASRCTSRWAGAASSTVSSRCCVRCSTTSSSSATSRSPSLTSACPCCPTRFRARGRCAASRRRWCGARSRACSWSRAICRFSTPTSSAT